MKWNAIKRSAFIFTLYEAKRYGIKMPEKVPMITQERAYTSPIWYPLKHKYVQPGG